MEKFVKRVLEYGGTITPLIIPAEITKGTGTFNPSIYNDNGKLLLNMRHCQVTIFHSERKVYEHQWGPLTYMNPENDITLTTTNYMCTLSDDMLINSYHKVDMTKLNVPPLWEFRGLEDGRVIRWNGKLYLCGVRRDTTTNGVGRMELSEIEMDQFGVREITRDRIPAPAPDNTYCEKNWMPILDMPFHYVKWCSPTEVVKYNPETKITETVFTGVYEPQPYDFRGGSQVIQLGDYRIAVVHTVDLYKSEAGRKDATYRHLFIVWDKDWNIVKRSKPFTFLDTKIEFCTGMTFYNGNLLIPFGIVDNAAYMLKVPMKFVEDYINE